MSSRISPELTDAQWRRIAPMFHEIRVDGHRRGRPAHNPRHVFAGILWVLVTGSVWSKLPEQYPDFRTCHRRFKLWFDAGLVHHAMERLHGDQGLALCAAMAERMQPWRAPAGLKPRFPVASSLRWPLARPFVER
ncbi:transposase [Paraburkholderia heleia]|uniref:transposase n=1 Tax=Paraburkholderia heleia TaxID=634127 RepID=UPI002AB7980A|nr:transposase [Paraburkholderia heleia]